MKKRTKMEKQITILLNETGQEYLRKMLNRYESTDGPLMLEKALLLHLFYVDRVAHLEKTIDEQRAVIASLEGTRL